MSADLIADRAMAFGAAQKRKEFVQLVELIAQERPKTWEFTVDGDERGYGPWGGIGVLRVPS